MGVVSSLSNRTFDAEREEALRHLIGAMSGQEEEGEERLLGDSGAAVCVCPLQYHEEFGLDLDQPLPELTMVDSSAIITYGFRVVVYEMNDRGFTLEIPYIVANVHLPVVAFSYLNDLGLDIILRAGHGSYLSLPDETDPNNTCPIYREGPLFWLQPRRTIMSNNLIAGVRNPTGNDEWQLSGMTLIRYHRRPREQLFNPSARGVELPAGVILEMIKPKRMTYATFIDGTTQVKTDDWYVSEPPVRLRKKWTGETRFALADPAGDEGQEIQLPDEDGDNDWFGEVDDEDDLPEIVNNWRRERERTDDFEADMWNVFDTEKEVKAGRPRTKDYWLYYSEESTLLRVHLQRRTKLFSPLDPQTCPVDRSRVEDGGDSRLTVIRNEMTNSWRIALADNWSEPEQDSRRPLQEALSEDQLVDDSMSDGAPVENFKWYESWVGYTKFRVKPLGEESQHHPLDGGHRDSDYWEKRGSEWIRHHLVPRKSLFVPEDSYQGPSPNNLKESRTS